MTPFLWLRLAVALVGILVWGYGANVDDARLRVAGMVVLLISLSLRFVQSRFRGKTDDQGH